MRRQELLIRSGAIKLMRKRIKWSVLLGDVAMGVLALAAVVAAALLK